jgi:hypothetical protein
MQVALTDNAAENNNNNRRRRRQVRWKWNRRNLHPSKRANCISADKNKIHTERSNVQVVYVRSCCYFVGLLQTLLPRLVCCTIVCKMFVLVDLHPIVKDSSVAKSHSSCHVFTHSVAAQHNDRTSSSEYFLFVASHYAPLCDSPELLECDTNTVLEKANLIAL